jgi:PAS domain S-box-containing protein
VSSPQKWRHTGDLVVVFVVAFLALGIAVVFDVTDYYVSFTRPVEDWELDELPAFLLGLCLASVWYARRRWQDMQTALVKQQVAERDTQASEARYRVLVEGSLQGLWVHQEGYIRFANRVLAQLFGYDHVTELLGQESVTLVASSDQALMRKALVTSLSSTSLPLSYEWRGRNKDGSVRWLESLLSPFTWQNAPAVLVTVVDITVRKREEQMQRQIAYELHDGLAQLLISAQHRLETYEVLWQRQSPEAPQYLTSSLACLTQAIDEIRRLMARLRPVVLETLGLVPAIQQYLEEARRETGWTLEFSAEIQGLSLAQEAETTIFRIVQEAVTNARKHASTPRLAVTLQQQGPQGETLMFMIQDWGIGFEPDKRLPDAQHFGLLSMRERARLLGGTCTVDSQPGQGTTVVVRLPLSPENVLG